MRNKIREVLLELEQEYQCRFVFAAESGSRAWGFSSLDSDYDVRAIYVKPQEWYTSISEPQKDTIEVMLPDDLDVSAWELRKALRLFKDSNLALFEWLTSPIQYFEDGNFLSAIRACIPHYFNPTKAVFHYLTLSSKCLETMESDNSIPIKKLFYVLRGLLAAHWSGHFGTMPPVKFSKLLIPELVPPDILAIIGELQERKKVATEKERIVAPQLLVDFIANCRSVCLEEVHKLPALVHEESSELDVLFRDFAMPILADQPTLIVLIGIPASGKSTFAKRLDDSGLTIVSLDKLQTRDRESKLFNKLLWYRRSCVIDNTNVTMDERRRFIAPAQKQGYKIIGYYFQSVLADCLKRNSARTGKARIPDKGIIIKSKALQLPELSEGFDELHYVTIQNGVFEIADWNPEAK